MSAVTRRAPRGRTPILGSAIVLTLVVAGVAVAYWLSGGSGSGSASTGVVQPVTLSPATPTAQLHPGGQASVVLTITNPNPGSVRVSSLTLDTTEGTAGFAVDAGHSSCGVASLSYATQNNGGAGWTLAGEQVLSVTLSNALSMATSAANACQGARFTVFLEASS